MARSVVFAALLTGSVALSGCATSDPTLRGAGRGAAIGAAGGAVVGALTGDVVEGAAIGAAGGAAVGAVTADDRRDCSRRDRRRGRC